MKSRLPTAAWLALALSACSTPPVRSTVDSYGDAPLDKSRKHFFVKNGTELLDQQAVQSCSQAARAAQVTVVDADCPDCLKVVLHTRLAGTQQVIRSTPGWGTSWGIFGGGSAVGVGYNTGTVTSRPEAGREIQILIYGDAEMKKPLREIQARSVGPENSVLAVASEMCAAAFKDYPKNISGLMYEVKPPDEKKASD